MVCKVWHYVVIISILLGGILLLDIIYLSIDDGINQKQIKQDKNKELFLVKNDPDNDGKMRFGYLTNPGYANGILSRYYINDDKKIGGVRLVSHPYQYKYSLNGQDKYYGPLFWNKNQSDNIYKTSGIRL